MSTKNEGRFDAMQPRSSVVRLENWSVVNNQDPYKAPELRRAGLCGKAYGHPLHSDGTPIITSPVLMVHDGLVFTKSGSVYELGAVDPAYEDVYPDARQRLFGDIKAHCGHL